MKRGKVILVAVMFAFCAAPNFAQQYAAQSSATEPDFKPNMDQMRLSTKSEHARELFGQAIVLSGNYRLAECLKGLRTAVGEDATFAAGVRCWGLLSATGGEVSASVARPHTRARRKSPR